MAITVEPMDELKPMAGLHVYVFAPLAVSVAESPLQMVIEGESARTGRGKTVIVTCDVALHPLGFAAVTV
jgi:hypothetical protein